MWGWVEYISDPGSDYRGERPKGARMTSKTLEAMLKELKVRLARLYGPRLKAVFIFGSYARGEADEESDVDVLIVLDRIEHYCSEVDRTSFITSELSLAHAVSISCVFVSEGQWKSDETAFLQNVREEALPA
jgi:predicted nucleotidyltransferase